MKLPTKLVFVKNVNSSVARSSFPADQIDKLAHLIMSVEGVINPIIVRRTGLESYEVVDGYFEYYAAVRAREISPLKGEMIQAIILEPDNEETLLEQVNIVRRNSTSSALSITGDSEQSEEVINLDQVVNIEAQFINLEKIFKAQFDELQKANRHLESRISELATQTPKLDFNEEVVTQIATKIVEFLPALTNQRSVSKSKGKILLGYPLKLNSVSVKQLVDHVPGIGKVRATSIVKKINEQGNFSSLEELSNIEGINPAMIVENEWHRYLEV